MLGALTWFYDVCVAICKVILSALTSYIFTENN